MPKLLLQMLLNTSKRLVAKARELTAASSHSITRSTTLGTCALTVCISIIGVKNMDRYDYSRRMAWCLEVQSRAETRGVDPILVAGLAFHESAYRNVTSNKGAQGVMQVMPGIHCKEGEPCDLIDAGLEYLQYWVTKTSSYARAICHYNSGNRCKPAGARWATKVMRTVNKLKDICEVKVMPKVGKKKFAYTPKGMKDAKAYAKKTKKKSTRKKK